MIKYCSKVEYLLDVLDKNNNKINSFKTIDEIFNAVYKAHNLPFLNSEFTLIIRHISTPLLRGYFNDLANEHNFKLSLNKKKKIKDIELKFIKDKDFIFDRTEQVMVFKRFESINSEFDDEGNYIGIRENLQPIKVNSICEAQKYIDGHRGQRIYVECRCSLCAVRFESGWKYRLKESVVYLCNSCKAKVRDGNHFHVIYTPMKH